MNLFSCCFKGCGEEKFDSLKKLQMHLEMKHCFECKKIE
jgi:hypothetical protein